jgi:hypothetical protein
MNYLPWPYAKVQLPASNDETARFAARDQVLQCEQWSITSSTR